MYSPASDKLPSHFALFFHPPFCHMLQDGPSLIVAVISVIHIASLTCLLFTQSSHMSLSSLMHPFLSAPFLSQSPHFPFSSLLSAVPFPLVSTISMYLFHPLTWGPPLYSCSLITHKLTLKASIIAYVKTHTNAHSAPYLTGLILSPCTVSPAPLINTHGFYAKWLMSHHTTFSTSLIKNGVFIY